MFSQFFGGYLLNNGTVSREALAKAMEDKRNTRLRLGVLAMNEGLMTAEQVREVNVTQQTVDKLFGDLAVELGFITNADVERLLSKQPSDYLLLGQALVNMGELSNEQLEKAMHDYKQKFSKDDSEEISLDQSGKLSEIVDEFFHFSTVKNARRYMNYVTVLFKNIIRFIGDDFTPIDASITDSILADMIVSQNIGGEYSGITAIAASSLEFKEFAKRFAKDGYFASQGNEFDIACVSEFLNVCNGLYAVGESNETGTEITLEPPMCCLDGKKYFPKEVFSIPVQFTFGEVEFIAAF